MRSTSEFIVAYSSFDLNISYLHLNTNISSHLNHVILFQVREIPCVSYFSFVISTFRMFLNLHIRVENTCSTWAAFKYEARNKHTSGRVPIEAQCEGVL